MLPKHAAVWIDHHEAKIFNVDEHSFELTKLELPHRQVRRSPTTAEHDHPTDLAHFYESVAQHLGGFAEILVVGPAKAKLELVKYLHARHAKLAENVVGVETADHPTDGQIAAHVRAYFHQPANGLGDRAKVVQTGAWANQIPRG